ncbi:hypothetical protein [Oceanirhabdus sp. W0125-5]|uniref:hypothetical protein n=1 Tax=Oceanirhabdus sp. W0125-5 TaxID=2999116 RepID=UPI0022F2FEB7|nr:hypothetical protein [Oceanirhabdus sp. W0125-5]WBW98269.1 hypothetical protein OW730_05735 [Oceanirhabdus sp. W0125-5]
MINNKNKVKEFSNIDIHDMKRSLDYLNFLCTQLDNETKILTSHIEYLNTHNPPVYFKDILNEGLYLKDILKEFSYYYQKIM